MEPGICYLFLSAAQPTDQGEESVVLLVVVIVVVGGGPFFNFPCTVFWGVKRQNIVSKWVSKGKKLGLSSWSIYLSKILYSTPQISESIPFLFSYLPSRLCHSSFPIPSSFPFHPSIRRRKRRARAQSPLP